MSLIFPIRKALGPLPKIAEKIPVLIGSEVAEWLAHWLLVLEVPGSIPVGGNKTLLVRTYFPLCDMNRVICRNDMIQCAVLRIGMLTG